MRISFKTVIDVVDGCITHILEDVETHILEDVETHFFAFWARLAVSNPIQRGHCCFIRCTFYKLLLFNYCNKICSVV